jgi:hypothetical protein
MSKTGSGAGHSPIHHAQRQLRERSETRLSRVEDPEKSPVHTAGAIQSPAPIDSRPESITRQPSAHQSSAHQSSAHESSARESSRRTGDALARELKLPNALFGVSVRTAAAVGFSAIVALLFVILMPGFRRPDAASSFSADVRQFTAALPPQSQDRQSQDQPSGEDAAKPAIEQFQRLLASSSEPAAQAGRDPSDNLLQRFMQWRLKTSSADNAQ